MFTYAHQDHLTIMLNTDSNRNNYEQSGRKHKIGLFTELPLICPCVKKKMVYFLGFFQNFGVAGEFLLGSGK